MIGLRLRQPLIIAFLVAGVVAGPSCLGIIKAHAQVELFAHIGIALLLFIVGLKLDLHLIRTTGPVALATGLGQVVFTSLIGYLIAVGMGMDTMSAAYVSVALTFSSTIIIVKLLSDKKEIDSLHGRIALGFLIVQDIVAIVALIGLASLDPSAHAPGSRVLSIAFVAAKGAALLVGVGVLMRVVLPLVLKRLASSTEMLLLFAVTWALLVSTLSDQLGLTKEVGAFLAGVALASTEYRDALGARLVTLRDFLLVFFFIDLGARMQWANIGGQMGQAAILSLFVLIGNPLIVLIIMGLMGYRRRTSFLAGLTVAQISEFSLIVASTGVALGHIAPATMGLVTVVGVVTILVSTYMILYSGPIYEALSGWLKVFERSNPFREAMCNECFVMPGVDMIIAGIGGYGRELAEHLLERGRRVIGVDYDPEALAYCRQRGIPVLYGDMADPETQDGLPLAQAGWVVSTIRKPEVDLLMLGHLASKGYGGRVALTARDAQQAELYLKAGPTLVLRPYLDAAEQGADALTGAWHPLTYQTEWPVSFGEIRIKSGSSLAGKVIRNVPFRAEFGVTIAAIGRAGRVIFNPDPDTQLFPGDRLVLMGPQEEISKAETMIRMVEDPVSPENAQVVSLLEARVPEGSAVVGRNLKDIGFRQVYGCMVVGIRRQGRHIITPGPAETLEKGDVLLVLGSASSFDLLRPDFELDTERVVRG